MHYDVSSSSYTGATCVLARFGHNRDHRKDLPCIVYGVMTDDEGRPISVDVYPGNTGDPTTVSDQVEKLKTRFRLERIVAVGDRGMLTQTQIDILRERPGLGWISALRAEGIRKLIDKGALERSLFDEQNLAEISSPDFPGEHLVACYNPILAERRKRKREALLVATEGKLEGIAREVARRTQEATGEGRNRPEGWPCVEQIQSRQTLPFDNRRQPLAMGTQATSNRARSRTGWHLRDPHQRVVRQTLSAENAVRGYKRLADVEQAFRSLKGLELLVRPIHHRLEQRVKAHIFVCLLPITSNGI